MTLFLFHGHLALKIEISNIRRDTTLEKIFHGHLALKIGISNNRRDTKLENWNTKKKNRETMIKERMKLKLKHPRNRRSS